MTSNITPFVCSNINEFEDEREYLRTKTFPRLRETLERVSIHFDPIQIDWNENDEYVKAGNLLRLLLHNIKFSSPFFMCLLGQQYGTHVEKQEKPTQNFLINEPLSSNQTISWVEKNLLVAAQTGFNHIITPSNYHNSFVDFQINLALQDEQNYPFYRFYYRQIEYLEEKFMQLSIQEKKRALATYEAENTYCDFKIKDLKMKIAKKGLIVKYYSSLEQLGNYVYEDFIEIIKLYLGPNLTISRPRNIWKLENSLSNQLKSFLLTEPLKELCKKLANFLSQKQTQSVHFKLENGQKSRLDLNRDENDSSSTEDNEQSEDYVEILKLRHINLTNNETRAKTVNSNINIQKQIFLIVGSRAKGKTAFMSRLYHHYNNSFPATLEPLPTELNESKDFLLFYFLNKGDYLLDIIINITLKMRSRYLKKDSSTSIDHELYDTKSIIEQFHASLNLGPACIFIDGLGELETQNTIGLNAWLPIKLENTCKFVITLSRSSDYYTELSTRKSCVSHELIIFKDDNDYREIFAKLIGLNLGTLSNNHSNNLIYGKFLSIYSELKTADHFSNPLFIQLIAQEIFTFDKEIYKNNPINSALNRNLDLSLGDGSDTSREFKNSSPTGSIKSSMSTGSTLSVNVINSYIEEVSTLREIIQKIIKRYIKKFNWSTDTSIPLSIKDNPGWVGEILCLLALSIHGMRKDSILRILQLRGYIDDLEVTDFSWRIFRMQFGGFIVDGLNGTIYFSHAYFKEAVQALLLDGFSVMIDLKPEPNVPSCKKNISLRQKEMHSYIIIDILQSGLNKSEFDFCCQIENKENLDNTDLSQLYLEILHELIYHIYMVYDLVNLCKILTSFKVLHLFHENRMKNPSIWFDYCEYLKLTANLETLRPILFSSFTIGIPQYIIEAKNEILTFKMINQKDLDEYLNKAQMISNSQNNSFVESITGKELVAPINTEKLLSYRLKSSENQLKVQSSITMSMSHVDVREEELDFGEFYEPFIDHILDLIDLVDLSKTTFGDSSNLLVINRALLLEDLMKHLDDKYFQENYSFLLFQIVNNIVSKNYPLNDTEKLKYSYLLQALAKMSMQVNHFETSLKYLIKCIDILEDLFSTFHISEIDFKYKNKMQVLQISNRLSFLNSSMALILLKMNNLDAAEILLAKAASYNSEQLNEAVGTIKNEFKLEKRIENNQKDIAVKYDSSLLFYRESLEEIRNNSKKLENFDRSDFENDDSGSYEAKYFFYFITGLFQVQQMNFKDAKKFFELALNLSIKWFGESHANTSKIYHYFGCFFSLHEMEFYNFRRSELYLRKALHIIEKEKKMQNEQKLKSTFVPLRNVSPLGGNLQKSSSSFESHSQTFRSNEYTTLSTNSVEIISKEALNYTKLKVNEEENRVAEILFDLGLLLITFESKISKREAVDCLRRSLDIKVLIFGPDHSDCKVIKKKLNEVVTEYSQFISRSTSKLQHNENQRESIMASSLSTARPTSRPASSVKNYIEVTPKQKIENLRKQNNMYANDHAENNLTKWIKRNSIINLIPSKRGNVVSESSSTSKKYAESVEMTNTNQTQTQRSFTERTQSVSQDNEFLQTSIYADANDNFPSQPNSTVIQEQVVEINAKSIDKVNQSSATTAIKKLTEIFNPPPSLLRPQSNFHGKIPRIGSTKARNEIHSRSCKTPTALSIDVHNIKTINGPHSCLRTMLELKTVKLDETLNKNVLVTSKSVNGMNKNEENEKVLISDSDVKGKILKKIYYKSAWYDVPPGSSKRRFRSYVKVTPNA